MRPYRALLIIIVLMLLGGSAAHAADDTINPKNTKATASGDNPVLLVPADKRCRIHKIVFLAGKDMTAAVGVYVKAGSQNLCGDSTCRFAIDKSGIDGFQGMSIGEDKYGIMVTQTAGDDVVVNLDDAQDVIVIIVYSYIHT